MADHETAQHLPDASHLPAGMVLLPSGQRVTLETFFQLHSADIRAFPDAQIAVAIPAWQPSEELKSALKGFVGAAAAVIVGMLVKNPNAAKMAGGFASGYIAADAADWVAHEISHGAKVRIIRVRDFMGD